MPIQPVMQQRGTEANEGDALGRELLSGEAAEPAEAGAVVQCFGSPTPGGIVPCGELVR